MSQENVEIVRRMWDHLNSAEEEFLPAFLNEVFDSEIEWHARALSPRRSGVPRT